MAARVLRRRRRADGPETLETSDFSTNSEAPQLFANLDDLTARRGVRLCREVRGFFLFLRLFNSRILS